MVGVLGIAEYLKNAILSRLGYIIITQHRGDSSFIQSLRYEIVNRPGVTKIGLGLSHNRRQASQRFDEVLSPRLGTFSLHFSFIFARIDPLFHRESYYNWLTERVTAVSVRLADLSMGLIFKLLTDSYARVKRGKILGISMEV